MNGGSGIISGAVSNDLETKKACVFQIERHRLLVIRLWMEAQSRRRVELSRTFPRNCFGVLE